MPKKKKERNDIVAYRKTGHAQTSEDGQGWEETTINDTLNSFDSGESRTPTVITQTICIGNGQLHDALSPSEEVCKTLNCMEDPMKILTKKVVQGKTYGIDQQGGKGMAGYTEDVAPTLAGDSHGTPHGVCYNVEETNISPSKVVVAYGFDPGAARDVGGLWLEECSKTLTNGACPGHHNGVCYGVTETPKLFNNHPLDSRITGPVETSQTLGVFGPSGDSLPIVLNTTSKKPDKHISNCMSIDGYNQSIEMEIHPALRTGKDSADSVCYSVDAYNQSVMIDKMNTMRGCEGSDAYPITCYSVENRPQDSRIKINEQGICQTLDARMGMGGGNVPMVMEEEKEIEEQTQMIVRRLTPLECERLQGFPDGWTDIGDWVDSKGKTHKGESDSPRYKALGNSIAIPFWQWMAGRIVAQYDRPTTMGSLFDGIGGFPLAFSRWGCEPVWASEIEEFPIAVTKKRFPEREEE